MANIWGRKPIAVLQAEAKEGEFGSVPGEPRLRRTLSLASLIALGIGCIIGAGIFVLTGNAAAAHAGPPVSLSFILAGLVSTFAGLCPANSVSVVKAPLPVNRRNCTHARSYPSSTSRAAFSCLEKTLTRPHPGVRVSSGGYRPREFPVRSPLHLFRGFRGPERRSAAGDGRGRACGPA
jgi:hypothetical protein